MPSDSEEDKVSNAHASGVVRIEDGGFRSGIRDIYNLLRHIVTNR